jgi:Uma2 family endonuclease
MSAALVLPDLSTPEAFVAWVELQPVKYEMAGGRLVMMAGGSGPHSLIAANAIAALRPRLRGGPCRTYTSDFMIQIGPGEWYYPDVSVVCGDGRREFADRPRMVIEVLSEGTKRFDLTTKLPAYLRKPGLAYVLYLFQDEPKAWLYRPGAPDAEHRPDEIDDLAREIPLPDLGVSLPMAELYEDVDLGRAG